MSWRQNCLYLSKTMFNIVYYYEQCYPHKHRLIRIKTLNFGPLRYFQVVKYEKKA